MKELKSIDELKRLYDIHETTIRKFYEIKCHLDTSDDLCKKAITGSTYRSFVRNKPKIVIGMSEIFKQIACSYFESNPTIEKNQKLFLKSLSKESIGLFKNLPKKI